MMRTLTLATLAVVASAGAAHAQERITLDGSSTVYPVSEAVSEEFQKAKGGAVQITVGISGTGGGFKKFCRGETDISNASRPILKEEMEACRAAGVEYIELPIAFDALTVAVSPSNSWIKQLTIADLKKFWEPGAQGKITHWNQVNPEWPNEPVHLFGAGSDSGTFDYFTEAVVGKAKSSRGDYTASEDDNVLVQGIQNDKNALGYLPYAYYSENEKAMKAVPIVNPKGEAVLPSREAVQSGTYVPLARPLFIYVNTKAAARPIIKEYIKYYMSEEGQALIDEVAYVPLPAAAYEIADKKLDDAVVGTAFGGVPEVGLPIEEILNRETVK
ncbi:PstS family phosphate ABC transporter substrate-binding protein [Inquilinus sp. Marseille-Q2685]|uniref:PstS family phosphate ABC transporter substrate-binding protein n=1 Tax=Inquilinus sp. Marseille-Q2685 TaxID=2866581 RepID=UPI001CE49465|nr:PstS family phosphate ABC transporter substrate-binding protein [Inquilinus sp. Marseille-Q2685]